MKVLVINQSDFERQIIMTLLESKYNAQVIETLTETQAIELLKMESDFNCIVSDLQGKINLKSEDALVINYLTKKDLKIPYILCSSVRSENLPEIISENILGKIDKSSIVANLTKLFSSFEQNTKFRNEAITHCRVLAKVLHKINFVNCGLYLKISETKFIKIKNAGDAIDEELILKYEKKNIDSFYLLRKDAQDFVDYLMRNLLGLESFSQVLMEPEKIKNAIEKVEDPDLKKNLIELTNTLQKAEEQDKKTDSILNFSSHTQNQVRDVIKSFNISQETETLIKMSIHFTLNVINENPKLSELFKAALKNGGNYYSSHSILLTYISCALATSLGWNSDFTKYKLCLASFLHDIWLEEKLAKFQTIADILVENESFSKEEINLFSSHPEKAAMLIRTLNELPPDVDQIVFQHHERPSGFGFPLKLDYTQLAPLSCAFIVSHDLVSFIMDEWDKAWSLDAFLSKYAVEYNHGHFKKIHDMLCKLNLLKNKLS